MHFLKITVDNKDSEENDKDSAIRRVHTNSFDSIFFTSNRTVCFFNIYLAPGSAMIDVWYSGKLVDLNPTLSSSNPPDLKGILLIRLMTAR